MRAIDADAMIDRLKEWDTKDKTDKALYNFTLNRINEQPTIQPEIIYCKDCVKHNKGLGNYEVHSACPLVSWRDKAQGHEFDYQFCAYAEKREVTE